METKSASEPEEYSPWTFSKMQVLPHEMDLPEVLLEDPKLLAMPLFSLSALGAIRKQQPIQRGDEPPGT